MKKSESVVVGKLSLLEVVGSVVVEKLSGLEVISSVLVVENVSVV